MLIQLDVVFIFVFYAVAAAVGDAAAVVVNDVIDVAHSTLTLGHINILLNTAR